MGEPIENHGIVGDLRTAALVGLDGTVDFLCWPRFDSPSVFVSLPDDEKGGRFELAPVLDGARHRQLYLPDTNVLLTRFLSHDGVAEISDYMGIGGAQRRLRWGLACAERRQVGLHSLVRAVDRVASETFRHRTTPPG